MAFRFDWQFFNLEELYETCKIAITQSIAKSKRPPEIAEPLQVVDLQFGQKPPELVLHSLPEVSETRAHLVFKLKYEGNAQITLQSMVEANPLRVMLSAKNQVYPSWIRPQMVEAQSGLLLPFRIKVFSVQLDTLADVIYTKHGVVVTFRNNPVKSVAAQSSLDALPGVTKMINEVVKNALADVFNEDVPEAVFKARSSKLTFPDPTFGARRAYHQFTTHTKFLELGIHVCTPLYYNPYNSLSLGAVVEHSIPARQCLGNRISQKSTASSVSVQDMLEKSPAPPGDMDTASSCASMSLDSMSELSDAVNAQPQRRKPSRRVIKVRKSQPHLPDNQQPASQLQTDLAPHPAEMSTPPLTYSESPVFESPPRPTRRHSIPAPPLSEQDQIHFKIRTASLQPPLRPQF